MRLALANEKKRRVLRILFFSIEIVLKSGKWRFFKFQKKTHISRSFGHGGLRQWCFPCNRGLCANFLLEEVSNVKGFEKERREEETTESVCKWRSGRNRSPEKRRGSKRVRQWKGDRAGPASDPLAEEKGAEVLGWGGMRIGALCWWTTSRVQEWKARHGWAQQRDSCCLPDLMHC